MKCLRNERAARSFKRKSQFIIIEKNSKKTLRHPIHKECFYDIIIRL